MDNKSNADSTEQEHGITNNSNLEAHPSTFGNNSAPSSSTPSQNPFLDSSCTEAGMSNGSSNTYPTVSPNQTHHSSTDDLLGLNSSFAPSTHESSQGNPFCEPTNTNNVVHVESLNPFIITEHEHEHQGMANSNLETSFSPTDESSNPGHNNVHVNTNAPSNSGSVSQLAAESSDNENPINSMHQQGQSGDVAGQHSTSTSTNSEISTNRGSEIQNPPSQVMERLGESNHTSKYVFPSHVFARNNTNAPVEWSTASNESLFSIYMGNMSFSNDLVCFGKSCELDKLGDPNMRDPPNASPNHQPQAPVSKFNDISQKTAELHEEGSKVTEAKAAETMREVIMENCLTKENAGKTDDKSFDSEHQLDASNKSYAFRPSTDGDKSVSSKGDNQKQQKQSEEKESPNTVDQAPASDTDAPSNNFLCCFPCCTSRN